MDNKKLTPANKALLESLVNELTPAMINEHTLDVLNLICSDNSIEYINFQLYKLFNSSSLSYNDEMRILLANRDIIQIFPKFMFLVC